MKYGTKALIMFSGGQDSATCLAWAIDKYDYIETVGFNYDQRHLVEMECRKTVLRKVRSSFPEWNKKIFDDHIIDLNSLGKISNTSLTRNMEITLNEEGLPSKYIFNTQYGNYIERRRIAFNVCAWQKLNFYEFCGSYRL